MPVCEFSTSKLKPRSVQKDFTTGHTCSGGSGTLSQRWAPSRSTRMLFSAVGATCAVAAAPAEPRDSMPEALTVPVAVRKRPSRANWVRSGGTSSGAVFCDWLR